MYFPYRNVKGHKDCDAYSIKWEINETDNSHVLLVRQESDLAPGTSKVFKICKVIKCKRSRHIDTAKREVDIQRSLKDSPYVSSYPDDVAWEEASHDDKRDGVIGYVRMYMPYYLGGDLDRLLEHQQQGGEKLHPFLAVAIAWDVIRGTAACHAKKILHCDIKTSNVFLTHSILHQVNPLLWYAENPNIRLRGDMAQQYKDFIHDSLLNINYGNGSDVQPSLSVLNASPNSDGIVFAKVGDFGLACEVSNTSKGCWEKDYVGTNGFCPPEIERLQYTTSKGSGEYYTNKSDVYSLGMILRHLFSKPDKLIEEDDGRKRADRVKFDFMFDDYPEQLLDLIESCIDTDPRRRPSIHEVLQKFEEMVGVLSSRLRSTFTNLDNAYKVYISEVTGVPFPASKRILLEGNLHPYPKENGYGRVGYDSMPTPAPLSYYSKVEGSATVRSAQPAYASSAVALRSFKDLDRQRISKSSLGSFGGPNIVEDLRRGPTYYSYDGSTVFAASGPKSHGLSRKYNILSTSLSGSTLISKSRSRSRSSYRRKRRPISRKRKRATAPSFSSSSSALSSSSSKIYSHGRSAKSHSSLRSRSISSSPFTVLDLSDGRRRKQTTARGIYRVKPRSTPYGTRYLAASTPKYASSYSRPIQYTRKPYYTAPNANRYRTVRYY